MDTNLGYIKLTCVNGKSINVNVRGIMRVDEEIQMRLKTGYAVITYLDCYTRIVTETPEQVEALIDAQINH